MYIITDKLQTEYIFKNQSMSWVPDIVEEIKHLQAVLQTEQSIERKLLLMNRLCLLLIKEKEYDEALNIAHSAKELAITLPPNEDVWKAYFNLGKLLHQKGQLEDALDHFNTLLFNPKISNHLHIEVLQELTDIYYTKGNFSAAYEHASTTLVQSQQLPHQQIILKKTLRQLYLLEFNRGRYNKSLEYARKSLALNLNLKDQRAVANSLEAMTVNHIFMGNYAQAMQYLNGAKAIAREENLLVLQKVLHYDLSLIKYGQSNYPEAMDLVVDAIKIFKEKGKKNYVRLCRSLMGRIHLQLDNFPMAFINFSEALKIAQQLDIPEFIAAALIDFANLYKAQGEFFKALDYYAITLNKLDKAECMPLKVLIYINMAEILLLQENETSAINYFNEAQSITEQLNFPYYTALFHLKKGQLYLYQKNQQAAQILFKEAEIYFGSNQLINLHTQALNYISFAYLDSGQTNKSLQTILIAQQILPQLHSKRTIAQTYETLYKIHKTLRKFEKALYFHEFYKKYDEQILSHQKLLEVKKLEAQLDIQNKEVFIANLQQDKKRLKEQKRQEIKKFASIASHDLRTPLNHIQSFAHLIKERSQELLDEDSLEFLTIIEESSRKMTDLIKQLVNFSNAGLETIPATNIDLNISLDKVKNKLRRKIKDNQAQIRVDVLPEIMAHDQSIALLFFHLLDNAIKFRDPNVPPKIHISIQKNEANYHIQVKDNGLGIPENDYERVFELFRKLHTNNEYEGFGVGLPICRKIVQRYDGDIWIKGNEHESGITVHFTLPM